ncbi:BolA (bacterial stress-induced morphogen)-related protein [Phaffia rhodozyma]|uniref:BolA (Bacterial stress-induced morphogen)-related protein n=1 Tax=Phaffia rhodozyma TaxID=264483 RepID=A0A0F7STX9_PHARH|nr:BolA (bacterial stress-induced morphogen)-related protein [Phaffia rhodozyma]
MSAVPPEALRSKLESGLVSFKHADIIDSSSGCGMSYSIVVVADDFEGLNTLKRNRLVNSILAEEIAQLHAFSQKTLTSAQYLAQGGKIAANP